MLSLEVLVEPEFDGNAEAVVTAILEVGRQRRAVLDQMRAALECGQDEKALSLARKLCGMTGKK